LSFLKKLGISSSSSLSAPAELSFLAYLAGLAIENCLLGQFNTGVDIVSIVAKH
jgi:hypothetical protein